MNHWTLQVFSHPNQMDLAEMPHMQLEKHKPQACFWVAKLSPC